MISRCIFIFAHALIKPRAIWTYYVLCANEKKSKKALLHRQKKALAEYLKFCRDGIPYYSKIIPSFNVDSNYGELQLIMDSIPILKKEDIIKNRELIELPYNKIGSFKRGQTGGSTGEPLKYRISRKCDDSAFAILYRGLGRGGYKLGDRMAIMAGGSLVTKRKSFKTKLISFVMNTRKYSSYGISDSLFQEYYDDIVRWKPKYIRGYPSSIFEFAKFVSRNDYELKFDSVFTTAEMLFDHQREYIELVFDAKVFNCYGLNDGGVTAFECEHGAGLHIDFERGYLEVVDVDGKQVFGEVGKIVATSILNKATPFVRYDTGDLGVISDEPCACGSPYPLLNKLVGRTTDILNINGRVVGSPVLTVLMASVDVVRYQFIQESKNRVVIVIEKGSLPSPADEDFIRRSLFSNIGEFELIFIYDEGAFEVADGGKHKVVVNKLC